MSTKEERVGSPAEIRAIAKEAYIYGFPLVDNYRILYSYFVDRSNAEYKAPWNELYNSIQTPNSDTPYSELGADLRAEPLVLTIPPVERGRYYSAQFIDLYTFNFAYVGSRATGNSGGRYLLAGPRWEGDKPDGIDAVLQGETEFALVLYRTQLFAPDDLENVTRVQAGYKVQTLSSYLGKAAPAPPARTHFVKPLSAEQERSSLDFFNILNFVLQYCPIHRSERALRARFGKAGIGTGRKFNPDALSPEQRKAVEGGISDAWLAQVEVLKSVAAGTLTPNDLFGTREHLNNNYLYRMVAAASGIYGNSAEEAAYHSYSVDADQQKLDGANRYTLRFAPALLPPVNAFWSVTLYELPAQLLSANSLNRYLINSAMLPQLQRDGDGGLTISVQHESPGHEREANWLPAPPGAMKLVLRMYWPKPEVISGRWKPPELQRRP